MNRRDKKQNMCEKKYSGGRKAAVWYIIGEEIRWGKNVFRNKQDKGTCAGQINGMS